MMKHQLFHTLRVKSHLFCRISHYEFLSSLKASKRGSRKTAQQSTPESGLKSGLKSAPKSAPKSALKIIEQISNNPRVSVTDLANLTGYSRRWVVQTMIRLQELNVIKRIGTNRSGYWEIIDK